MKFYQETTDYKDKVANGIYLLDDAKSKMYAYLAPGQTEVKTFKNFIRIDTRGRKFKAVPNTFNYTVPTEVAVNPSWVITGSKGDKYTVEKGDNGYSCTCSGFKFRGACKHVRQVEVATA